MRDPWQVDIRLADSRLRPGSDFGTVEALSPAGRDWLHAIRIEWGETRGLKGAEPITALFTRYRSTHPVLVGLGLRAVWAGLVVGDAREKDL